MKINGYLEISGNDMKTAKSTKRTVRAFIITAIAMAFIFTSAIKTNAQNTGKEVNVALSKWGTTATASSSHGEGFTPDYAIDGRWIKEEDNLGRNFLWIAHPKEDKHWLVLDFGFERNIHKVVIRHDGIFTPDGKLTTSDFSLQYVENEGGPWNNLTAPIINNKLDESVHEFQAVKTRYFRLWIDKSQQEENGWAHIHELEVFASLSKDEVLVAHKLLPSSMRMGKKEEEVKLELKVRSQNSINSGSKLIISSETFEKVLSDQDFIQIDETNEYISGLWLTLNEIKNPIKIEAVQSGKKKLVRMLPVMSSKINR